MPPTCSMSRNGNESMMMQQSISPNGTNGRQNMDDGRVQSRKKRSDEPNRKLKSGDPRDDRRSNSGRTAQSPHPPTTEGGQMVRRVTSSGARENDTTRSAQERTLTYYEKSARQGSRSTTSSSQPLDVSMHTYFPEAQGEESATDRQRRAQRSRPPSQIGGGGEDAAPREKQRRPAQEQRPSSSSSSKQQQQHARSLPNRPDGYTAGSSLTNRLEKDEQEKERRQRERSQHSADMTARSGDSVKSGRSKGSTGSRGEPSKGSRRSESVPRREHANDHQQDQNAPVRRLRSNSVHKPRTSSSQGSQGGMPPPPRRISSQPAGSNPRPSSGAQASKRVPSNSVRSTRSELSSSGRHADQQHQQRRSYNDLDDLLEADEQSFDRDPKVDPTARRRQRQTIMQKKTAAHRSQRSLDASGGGNRSSASRRPGDDRPRRNKSNEGEMHDERPPRRNKSSDNLVMHGEQQQQEQPRRMRKSSDADMHERPRRKASDAGEGDRLRRRGEEERPRRRGSINGGGDERSRGRGSMNGGRDNRQGRGRGNEGDSSGRGKVSNLEFLDRHAENVSNSSSRGSRLRRSGQSSERSLAVDSVFDNGSNSSNPFADAMKAILLDGHANVNGFNTEKEMEKRIADLVWGKFQSSTLGAGMQRMAGKSDANTASFQMDTPASDPSAGPPQNTATIVLTDVQGSTSLWEANPQAMQEALDIHDKILRRFCAFHNGYEIDTEGDAFFLAFHTPMDAFGFALGTQSALFDTEWSKEILATDAGVEVGCYRGLRVRMGIHQGPVTSCKNEVTGRTEYIGDAMSIAKCVEGMTHGGQILTTFETWNVASYKAEADLGSPQVVDLGCHLLNPKGSDDAVARRIIQLVPASLSFDYFASRRIIQGEDAAPPAPSGRQFDPPITDEQVSASFHDAPYENNEATIAFVYFSEIETQYEDPKPIVAALIRLIGDLLIGTPGYHSQSNMLAFPDVNEAIKFGLGLMEELKETKLTDDYADLSKLIKFGCVHDTFLTMGPHKTTGRADYFGKVVNRAARITAKSELGTVNYGVLADASVSKLPVLDRSIVSELKGIKQLKGVQEDMALYECTLDTRPLGLQRGRVVPIR